MLLGLIADTHDNLPMIREAVSVLSREGAEALVHAGDFVAPFALKEVLKFDGPIYAVFGNNDGERKGLRMLLDGLQEGSRQVELDGRKIAVAHDREDLTDADVAESDVIVVGHTHRAEVRPGRPVWVNPGECAGWLHGECTVATIDTGTLETKIINLGESS